MSSNLENIPFDMSAQPRLKCNLSDVAAHIEFLKIQTNIYDICNRMFVILAGATVKAGVEFL